MFIDGQVHYSRSVLHKRRAHDLVARVYQENPKDTKCDFSPSQETNEEVIEMSKINEAAPGSSFDVFLKGEGIYEDVQAIAIKSVIAWQIAQEMEKQDITKKEMALRMKTSRSQLDRLLDPDNDQVKLATLGRAAQAVGRELRLELS